MRADLPMNVASYRPLARRCLALSLFALLAACMQDGPMTVESGPAWSPRDQECLARAMYFESKRSSEEGMLAVGTVVMNRVRSERFPATVCGVVGQPGQFAAGVLERSMDEAGRERTEEVAALVLAGRRHPKAGRAMFFHQAGLKFSYSNMRYVLVAGGNAFYEKVSRRSH